MVKCRMNGGGPIRVGASFQENLDMIPRLLIPALALAFARGGPLSTDYTKERTLRIEAETVFEMTTTDFEMLRDGEPVDRPFGGGEREEVRRVVTLDRVLAHEEGEPTLIRRTFEEVSSKLMMEFGGEPRERDFEGPLADVTLEIKVEDGEASATVAEGTEPDGEALVGHKPTLALDALLPPEGVEVGESWDIEGEALLTALGFDLEKALFPRPEPEGGRGEGRGGGRGRMRRGGSSTSRLFLAGDWQGKATFASSDLDFVGAIRRTT